MEIIMFIKIFISVLFLISFIAKLINFDKFKSVFLMLGFNRRLSLLGTQVILLAELLVSVLLVFKATTIYGEFLLLLLILTFIFTTLYSQLKKLKIKCNCFGAITDETLGMSTYVRNLFLLILYFILTVQRGDVGIEDFSAETVIELFLSSINILLIYFLLNSFIRLVLLRRSPRV